MAQNEPTPAPDPLTDNGSGDAEAATATLSASEEKARKRKTEQAKRARQKRAEEIRRLKEEQEERNRWEAMDTLSLTQLSSRAYGLIIGGLGFICLFVGLVLAILGDTMGWPTNEQVIATTAFGAAGLLFLVIAFAVPTITRAHRILRKREQAAREKAKEATDELADATDLGDLLRANRKQMEAYDELARVQSRESFRNSQIAMAVGLLVIVGGAGVVLTVSTTPSKVAVATLTGLAGALSGYMSKTFLRVYERTQQQLTFFFQQPLINSYILAADRLVENIDEGAAKDTQRSRVVEHVLQVLIQLPEGWGEWTRGDSRRLKRAMSKSASGNPESAATGKT
jgi:Flp pilus assembly protein TadB